ncbi:MAG: ion transporter [Caldilineaceae bacterium]|nr:ion transporter [Caldilineaceae bacterium]
MRALAHRIVHARNFEYLLVALIIGSAVLLGIILYVYSYVGYAGFSEYDPVHWGDSGVAVLSLFQVVTMDDWGNIMQTAIEQEPMAWIYFVSFVIISAFIVANLFIAVVISNLEEVMRKRRQPRPAEAPASRVETLRELRAARQTLDRLEERLQQLPE